MYSSQHAATSSHHHSNSPSPPPTDSHDVSGSNDFSAFTANLVSIAAEASNVEDDVSVNLDHHHSAHHSDVDVTLDNIHQSIENLVNEGRTDASPSKQFRQLQQQFARHSGELSSTDIEQTTNALMEMAQSSLAHQSSLHSPTILSTGGSSSVSNTHAHQLEKSATGLGRLEGPESSAASRTKSQLKNDEGKFKKSCQFCGKIFSHPGSLGRHLDLKRGTRLHPASEIDLIRADVKRRGDAVEIKTRRAKRAKVYNSREDVKERARIRRKLKERGDRAHAAASRNFIKRIGLPSLPPHPSFAYVVLYFLSPSQWPHDPPTTQTYAHLEQALQPLRSIDIHMFNDYVNKVNVAFEQWSVMNKQSKMEIWAREQRRVAEAALGSLSLYDLGSREIWLKIEEERILNLLNLEADEKEDGEERGIHTSKSLNDSEQEDGEEGRDSLDATSEKVLHPNSAHHILLPKQEPAESQSRINTDQTQGLSEHPSHGLEDSTNVLDPAITKHPSSTAHHNLLKDPNHLNEVADSQSQSEGALENLISGHATTVPRLNSVHVVHGPASYERPLI